MNLSDQNSPSDASALRALTFEECPRLFTEPTVDPRGAFLRPKHGARDSSQHGQGEPDRMNQLQSVASSAMAMIMRERFMSRERASARAREPWAR